MAFRAKHRRAAQIKRAGEGRKIKSDLVPGTKRMTDEYKSARVEARRREKLVEAE